MDQSNSNQSNSNQTSNQHRPQGESSNSSDLAPQPKSFKVKGKYTPKNQASPGGTNGQQHIQSSNPYGASSVPGDGSAYSQGSNPEHQTPYFGAPPIPPVPPHNGKVKHSGLGIASFIISIIAMLTIVIGLIVMFSSVFNLTENDLLKLQDPAQLESMLLSTDSIPSFIVSILIGGLLMMGSAFISFIGFILGVISLFMKHRRKIFGILGTIFNGLICFGGLIFMLISFISTFSL